MNKQKGFTLMELLIVVAIVGVLASVILTSINQSKAKSSVSFVKSSLNQIRKQSEIYYDANGNYGTPQTFGTFLPSTVSQICAGACFMDDPIILASLKKFDPHVGPYYPSNHPDQRHFMSYTISTNRQKWAIAMTMVDGPRTYCYDSSGQIISTSAKDQYGILNGGDGACVP